MGDHPDGRVDNIAAARDQLCRGLAACVEQSVKRRAAFMHDNSIKELAEDVTENVMAFLQGVFELT